MRINHSRHKDLASSIAKIKSDIDSAAGQARERYITNVPGQEAVYLEKKRQSDEFKANGSPADTAGYEYVVAEANARGVTNDQAADAIIQVADVWNKTISPDIEQKRIEAKMQIDALPPTATIQDVVQIGHAAVTYLNSV